MQKTPEIIRLIHEKFSEVMAYAFSRHSLGELLSNFTGDWKYLRKSLDELSEIRADRVLFEMATQLRTLDDAQDINSAMKRHSFGTVTRTDGKVEDLTIREVTNKIIHAESFEWDFSDPKSPTVICRATQAQQAGRWSWVKAEIKMDKLAFAVGQLMF